MTIFLNPFRVARSDYKSPARRSPAEGMPRSSTQRLPRLSSLALSASPAQMDLRFRVRVALSNDKSSVHIANKSETATDHPYDYYCGVWMGGSNPHMDYQRLASRPDGTGEASLTLRLLESDVDTFKIGVYVRDPDTLMQRHVASGCQTLQWLGSGLEGVRSFDEAKQSILVKDNYSKNHAVLHFCDDASDVKRLREFIPRLARSVMHDNEEINRNVMILSMGLHDLIEENVSISNINGGPNFLNCACFTQSMGCAINYSLLDMTYSSERHRLALPMLAYACLSTVHHVGMTHDELLRLDDADFVHRFIVPLCTCFTACPKTAVYSGDETIGPTGKLDFPTEDFAMVMSKHFYVDVGSDYRDALSPQALRDMTLSALVAHIQALRARASPGGARPHSLIVDDCETLSGMVKSHEGAIHQYHLASAARVEGGAGGSPLDQAAAFLAQDRALGQMMWDETRDMPSLAAVPLEDFMSAARLLGRYGRLRENAAQGRAPCAQMGLCVVSAKGPSFSFAKADLNGHACVLAQCLDAQGAASYSVAEGTSHLNMRNLPAGCPPEVTITLTSGDHKFPTMDVLNIVAANLGAEIKTFGKTRIGESMQRTFGNQDPYESCPFYMAGFFAGLQMDSCTPCVVPVEMRKILEAAPPLKAGDASGSVAGSVPAPGSAPAATLQRVFGAPVVGMSSDATRAIPVDLGAAMGDKDRAHRFLGQLRARDAETYPPRADVGVLKTLMSHWLEVPPLASSVAVKFDPEKTWVCTASEGFDDSDVLRAMLEYKTRVARRFNALQAEDPKSDGVHMTVRGHMLSVVCQWYVPLPRSDRWSLSCARNLKLALAAFPPLAAAPAAAPQAAGGGGTTQVGSMLPCRFVGVSLGGGDEAS